MTTVNIHAKILHIETRDFEAVVTYGAEDYSETIMGAFILACESLDLDPDDYPVPHTDWFVSLVGSPITTYMRDQVVLARLK